MQAPAHLCGSVLGHPHADTKLLGDAPLPSPALRRPHGLGGCHLHQPEEQPGAERASCEDAQDILRLLARVFVAGTRRRAWEWREDVSCAKRIPRI